MMGFTVAVGNEKPSTPRKCSFGFSIMHLISTAVVSWNSCRVKVTFGWSITKKNKCCGWDNSLATHFIVSNYGKHSVDELFCFGKLYAMNCSWKSLNSIKQFQMQNRWIFMKYICSTMVLFSFLNKLSVTWP